MNALQMMRIASGVLGFTLVVLSARELHRAASDQQVSLFTFMNSDTLTCAAVYEDVVNDGYPIRSFSFPTTTVMFPDFTLYFLARSLTGSTASAMVLCSCALFVLELLGCYLLLRVLAPANVRWAQTLILLCMGALLLMVNARSGLTNPYFRLPIILTYHGGSMISLLFGMSLVLYLVNAPVWERRHKLALLALFVNTVLGVASDRLLLVHMLAPATVALLWLRLLAGGSAGGIPMARIASLVGIMSVGAATGQHLLRLLQTPWQDASNYYFYSFQNGWHSFRILAGKWRGLLAAGDALHWLVIVSLLGCIAHSVVHGVRRLTTRQPLNLSPVQRGLLLASSYYMAMTAGIVGAVCYAGMLYNPPHYIDFDWGGAARYFLPVLFMPFFLVALWLIPLATRFEGCATQADTDAVAPSPRCACASTFAVVGLVIFASVLLEKTARIPRNDDQGVWNYYPPYVQQLDAIADEYGLEYGLAAYWEAKVATLLSRKHLRVHQVIASPTARTHMTAFPWLCNSRCYFDAPSGHDRPPRYQFILVNGQLPIPTPSRDQLVTRFGEPAAALPCGPFQVLVYNRPSDEDFQNLAQSEAYINRVRFRSQPGESIRFEGESLPSAILRDQFVDEWIAREGFVPEGLLSDGPLLPLCESGTYRVRIVTSSAEGSPSGRWEINRVNSKYGATSTVASGEVEPGPMREAVGEVTIKDYQRGRAIDCRVHFNGTGWLRVHYLEITRIR